MVQEPYACYIKVVIYQVLCCKNLVYFIDSMLYTFHYAKCLVLWHFSVFFYHVLDINLILNCKGKINKTYMDKGVSYTDDDTRLEEYPEEPLL